MRAAPKAHAAATKPVGTGVAEHALVEDLLDQDGDGELAERGRDGEHRGRGAPLAQLGADGEAAAQHGDGAGVAQRLLLVGPIRVASLVVVAARRGRRR